MLCAGKDKAHKGDMQLERKLLPERPMKIVSPLPIQLPGSCCVICQKFWHKTIDLAQTKLAYVEKLGAGKNGACEVDSHVSLVHPVLSCTHYFQEPATQARNIKLKVPRIAFKMVLEFKLFLGVCPQSPVVADTCGDLIGMGECSRKLVTLFPTWGTCRGTLSSTRSIVFFCIKDNYYYYFCVKIYNGCIQIFTVSSQKFAFL